MKKQSIFLLVFLFYSFCLRAQTLPADSTNVVDKTTTFRSVQLLLPATLMAVGAIGVVTPEIKSLNRDVRSGMAGLRRNHYIGIDDYIQYLPVVSNFGLSLLGAKAKHSYVERVMVTATSYAAMGIMVNSVKFLVKEQRPDNSSFNSFPSGHTATVFMGAELVRMEYWDDSPLYGWGAYTIATGVAFLRIYNERHWCNDVIAGAGIGILSARIGFWLLPFERKLFRLDGKKKALNVFVCPYYDYQFKNTGGTVAISF